MTICDPLRTATMTDIKRRGRYGAGDQSATRLRRTHRLHRNPHLHHLPYLRPKDEDEDEKKRKRNATKLKGRALAGRAPSTREKFASLVSVTRINRRSEMPHSKE